MVRKSKYLDAIENLPPGLERAVLRIVINGTRANPVPRGRIVTDCALVGFRTTERSVREAIRQLRRQGNLILSMPGDRGGYYMAATLDEYEEFIQFEFGAKIYDMLETKKAMDQAARDQFGEGRQLGLGI
jgi:hypothetical protein